MFRSSIVLAITAALFVGCAAEKTAETAAEIVEKPVEKLAAPYVVTADMYPSPPEPHYGPQTGSIEFVDTDPGPTIGGMIYMKPAANTEGITQYMIHWGLEVMEPGTEDDAGNGDLGGDCRGFRDTGHVVMKMAEDAGDLMKWEIPQGTEVPKDAVYFVGHALYGDIHNLAKCTQTPIDNLVK